MRLICPNCGAQYEVPVEVIPQSGRDVQCSSCGHTWYQIHPDEDQGLAAELGQPEAETDWEPEIAAPRSAAPAPTVETTPELPDPKPMPPEAEPDSDARRTTPLPTEPDTAPAEDEVTAPARGRGLDPSVAEVLREEADREARQRAAEADVLESQPDLGLGEPDEDEAARRSRESRDRMTRMRGDVPETDPAKARAIAAAAATGATAAAAAAAGSRREMLPDIEEINQTLRASSERRAVETPQGRAPVDDRPTRGFGSGFRWVLGLAILAAALYILAPRIIGMFPGLEPVVVSYVQWIDAGRIWLDGQVAALLQMLDGMSSEATGE